MDKQMTDRRIARMQGGQLFAVPFFHHRHFPPNPEPDLHHQSESPTSASSNCTVAICTNSSAATGECLLVSSRTCRLHIDSDSDWRSSGCGARPAAAGPTRRDRALCWQAEGRLGRNIIGSQPAARGTHCSNHFSDSGFCSVPL